MHTYDYKKMKPRQHEAGGTENWACLGGGYEVPGLLLVALVVDLLLLRSVIVMPLVRRTV